MNFMYFSIKCRNILLKNAFINFYYSGDYIFGVIKQMDFNRAELTC